MTHKGAPHRRKSGDPLVPISGEHVRALLRVAKLSEREAVRALKDGGVHTAQTTLDHIIHGRQARCRASLRDGLASLPGAALPPEWLSGDYKGPTSGVADLNRLARPDTEIGRRIAQLRKDAGLSTDAGLLGLELGATPLYELVAHGLVRDIARQSRQRLSGLDEEDLAQLVRRLLSLDMWRRWLFTGPSSVVIKRVDMDRFAAAMGEALLIALGPWLRKRKVAFRKERLRRLQAALHHVDGDVTLDTTPTSARTGAVAGSLENHASSAGPA